MEIKKIISNESLEKCLDDTNNRIIEISSEADTTEYKKGHIPGAIVWVWKESLWHKTDRQFVTNLEMADQLGQCGINHEQTIILYSDRVQYGTYAFWVLSMCGHQNIKMLDGSRTDWLKKKLALSTEIPSFSKCEYLVQTEDQTSRVGRDNVKENLSEKNRILLDVRSHEEYSGERVKPEPGLDHGAERHGRIPGAKHLFYAELLNQNDTFKNATELENIFKNIGITSNTKDEIVVYCRLSHRATLVWFCMKNILGIDNVKIYDGSWTEWGSIVGFPIER